MSQGTRAVFVELQSVDATTLTSSSDWVQVGIVPYAVRNLFVDNLSDESIQLSIDNFDSSYGGNINMLSSTQAIYDIASNRVETKSGLWLVAFTIVYARNLGSTPGSGRVYIGGFHGKGD